MHSRVCDIDLKRVYPNRAGIILYTQYNNDIYFGLGRDSISHELTDFGGTAKYQKNNVAYSDSNVISAAIREFNEETLNIFEDITSDDLSNCLCVYDKYNMIIFVNIDIDPESISNKFNEKCKQMIESKEIDVKQLEVCGITWLSLNQFAKALYSSKDKYKTGILYYRVEKLLKRCRNFLNEL